MLLNKNEFILVEVLLVFIKIMVIFKFKVKIIDIISLVYFL